MKKDKKPAVTFKKINKSEDDITQVDQYTFYVKSSDPKQEPYFVYREHINKDRWLCDCMDFVMNMTDTTTKECKHIFRCKLRADKVGESVIGK